MGEGRRQFFRRLLSNVALAGPPLARAARPLRVSALLPSLSLDPAQAPLAFDNRLIEANLYDTLCTVDPRDGRVRSRVARRWWPAPGARQWQFELRTDIRWHQTPWFSPTRPLNAEDVVHSVMRRLRAEGAFVRRADSELIAAVSALSPSRVRFELHRPDLHFPAKLEASGLQLHSAEYAAQLPPSLRERAAALAPIGSGPYCLEQLQLAHLGEGADEPVLRLRPHPSHSRPGARLAVWVYDDSDRDPVWRWIALQRGQRDLAVDMPLAVQHGAPGALHLRRHPGISTYTLWIDSRRPPFDDKRVRLALCAALDTRRMASALSGDNAVLDVDQRHLRWLPSRSDSGDARALLAAAGARPPLPLRLRIATRTLGSELLVGRVFAASLARAGFAVRALGRDDEAAADATVVGCNSEMTGPLGELQELFAVALELGRPALARRLMAVSARALELAEQRPADGALASAQAALIRRALREGGEVVPLWCERNVVVMRAGLSGWRADGELLRARFDTLGWLA